MDTLDASQHYQPEVFSVRGRIGRLRYLAYNAILVLIAFGAAAVLGVLDRVAGDWLGFLTYPLMLAMFAGSVIMAKRRANDLNASGWWAITVLIPLVNMVAWLWLTFAPGKAGANDYGPAPAPNSRGIVVFAWIYAVFFVLGMIAAVAFPAYLGITKMNQGAGSESVEARF